MSTLEGRRVLVTGGSKGIGLSIAEQLLERGAKVAICGRSESKLERAAARVPGAIRLQADVGVEDDCIRVVRQAGEQLGGLDVLINNAGIGGSWSPLGELQAADMEAVWRVNVLGAALCAREALPWFRKNREAGGVGGDIVNISSTSGLKGHARGSAYSSSKFALKSLSQCWQAELRPEDVRVILVNPSEVQTAFGRDEEPTEVAAKKLVAADIADTVVATLALPGRALIPEVTVWANNPF